MQNELQHLLLVFISSPTFYYWERVISDTNQQYQYAKQPMMHCFNKSDLKHTIFYTFVLLLNRRPWVCLWINQLHKHWPKTTKWCLAQRNSVSHLVQIGHTLGAWEVMMTSFIHQSALKIQVSDYCFRLWMLPRAPAACWISYLQNPENNISKAEDRAERWLFVGEACEAFPLNFFTTNFIHYFMCNHFVSFIYLIDVFIFHQLPIHPLIVFSGIGSYQQVSRSLPFRCSPPGIKAFQSPATCT